MSTKKPDSTEERVTPPSKLPDPTNVWDPETEQNYVSTDAKVEPINPENKDVKVEVNKAERHEAKPEAKTEAIVKAQDLAANPDPDPSKPVDTASADLSQSADTNQQLNKNERNEVPADERDPDLDKKAVAKRPGSTGDLPQTPEQGKSEQVKQAKSSGKKAAVVTYRSRDEETVNIELMGVRPLRNPLYPGRHEWRVPRDLEKKADAHFHVRTGRIQKVTG